LESSVDSALDDSALLHVENGFGVGAGDAAVVDQMPINGLQGEIRIEGGIFKKGWQSGARSSNLFVYRWIRVSREGYTWDSCGAVWVAGNLCMEQD
jgi:hypothetical protein